MREVLVGPRDHPLDREVGVGGARHVAQQPPAQRVGADLVDDRDRVDRIASRLGELRAVRREIGMHEDLRRAAARPADSSIAGQYTAWKRRMPLPITWMRSSAPRHHVSNALAVGAVVERGDVVAQRVPPHVDDLDGSSGTGMPQPRARVCERDTLMSLEPAREERQHLVAVRVGHDLERAALDQVDQLLLGTCERRKNQFSSATVSAGVPCSGQQPSTSSAAV